MLPGVPGCSIKYGGGARPERHVQCETVGRYPPYCISRAAVYTSELATANMSEDKECGTLRREVCATGSMWGLLNGAPLWKFVLWWLARHTLYAGVVTAIILAQPAAIVYQVLGIFIICIHSYKIWQYLTAEDVVEEDTSKAHQLSVVTAEPSARDAFHYT